MTDGLGDIDLIRRFRRTGDEFAFRAVIERHVDMAYSAALRMLGESSAAEDAVTAAFVALRRDAAQLGDDVLLASWVHEAVCSACRRMISRGSRRMEAVPAGV